ncbi:hypothetical protein EW026_g4914 [Hermanssonia centrifuga]|uniref:Uncharacterized protein n=1 Tax=Hermanssonia centrifuga TaxID=98765 RepID=A0A4V3XA73_9APHY|nr:hypothetical protein EW026_g4914 [Hermanssonia centrifuga]
MQFKSTFSVLAAVVLSMASVKLATASPVVETRAAEVDGDIFACTDANWAGQCENLGFFNGQCENFPADLQDDISSIGPDAGWVCVLYMCVVYFFLPTPDVRIGTDGLTNCSGGMML